jgi:hypothetical protein
MSLIVKCQQAETRGTVLTTARFVLRRSFIFAKLQVVGQLLCLLALASKAYCTLRLPSDTAVTRPAVLVSVKLRPRLLLT